MSNLVSCEVVMLANEDADLTLCAVAAMTLTGQGLANETGATITARDPISDEVLATFTPADS